MQTLLRSNSTVNSAVAAVLTLAILLATFLMLEPRVAFGVDSNDFEITQEVTDEISFKTQPNNVTMTPALQGLTGGNAFGTSTFAVTTNSPTGYTVTLSFASSTAMEGDDTSSDIPNYTPAVGGTPDFTWGVGANTGEFGFTVIASTTPTDIDSRFKDNGAACNTGSGTVIGACWYNAADATTPVGIIDSSSATPSTGATSSLVFQVEITANPSPAIQTGFYTATATLTANVQ